MEVSKILYFQVATNLLHYFAIVDLFSSNCISVLIVRMQWVISPQSVTCSVTPQIHYHNEVYRCVTTDINSTDTEQQPMRREHRTMATKKMFHLLKSLSEMKVKKTVLAIMNLRSLQSCPSRYAHWDSWTFFHFVFAIKYVVIIPLKNNSFYSLYSP